MEASHGLFLLITTRGRAMRWIICSIFLLCLDRSAFAETGSKSFAQEQDLIGVTLKFHNSLVLKPKIIQTQSTEGITTQSLVYEKEIELGQSSCKVRKYTNYMADVSRPDYKKKLTFIQAKAQESETNVKKLSDTSTWTVKQVQTNVPGKASEQVIFLTSNFGSDLEVNCHTVDSTKKPEMAVPSDVFQTTMTLMMNGVKLQKNGEEYRPYKVNAPSTPSAQPSASGRR